VTAVDRPHPHLDKVFIFRYKMPVFCLQNCPDKRISRAILRPAPHPLLKHPTVGLDLPSVGRTGHDPRLKDRDVEDVEDRKRASRTIYREKKLS
jgi:hypothetical protein